MNTETIQDYISTNDIDLAAAIITLIAARPALYPGKTEKELVEIVFSATDEIRLIAQKYATGELTAPVKRLATNRNMLFRYIKEVSRTGREVTL